jgi:5'-phosphate synthase pdxT subunit
MKVGILAVQGDFEAHGKMLSRLGVEPTFVRTPLDLEDLKGIILPGGESSTHLKVLSEEGLLEALRTFAANGGAFFGTCAGAILLAREVKNPPQASLGLLDMSVLRNGYGRQLASDVRLGSTKLKDEPFEMVFIRAPVIERIGDGVQVLAECDGKPVMVQQGRVLASTFHPELTADSTIHEYFLKTLRNGA